MDYEAALHLLTAPPIARWTEPSIREDGFEWDTLMKLETPAPGHARILIGTLDAGIPTLGTCRSPSADLGPCTAVEERFADTFAKWALGGRVSLAGSGYGIPAPASLESWGSPLGLLAVQLDVD